MPTTSVSSCSRLSAGRGTYHCTVLSQDSDPADWGAEKCSAASPRCHRRQTWSRTCRHRCPALTDPTCCWLESKATSVERLAGGGQAGVVCRPNQSVSGGCGRQLGGMGFDAAGGRGRCDGQAGVGSRQQCLSLRLSRGCDAAETLSGW